MFLYPDFLLLLWHWVIMWYPTLSLLLLVLTVFYFLVLTLLWSIFLNYSWFFFDYIFDRVGFIIWKSEFIYLCLISNVFNPGLIVADDMLIVQTTNNSHLALNALVFILVFFVKTDLLDCIQTFIEAMLSKKNSASPTFSNLFELLEICFVSWKWIICRKLILKESCRQTIDIIFIYKCLWHRIFVNFRYW